MASKIINKGLKRTALSVALGMCFAGSVYAQSNASGSIAGTTTGGAAVVVENESTGFRREITANADGNYRLSSLPTGTYKVTSGGNSRIVTVTIGSTAQATTLGPVTVVGSGTINAIDVASVESTTILTSEQIAKIPVGRNITAVALLAPGTVKGDTVFGNLASFGGASVSENAYFVNGFNITNAFKNLAFAQVPFEGIAEQQVKTGGYGAEFGRSLGGVINLVTKRGSNEFHAGASAFMSPESLRETDPNLYGNDGKQRADNSQNNGHQESVQAWVSGALIEDRLFGYALVQYAENTQDAYPGTTTGIGRGGSNINFHSKSPTYLVKLDWNINDSNLLEFTTFSDKTKNDDEYFATQFGVTGLPTWKGKRGASKGVNYTETGGANYVLKYTGYLTDNFTLSALAATGKYSRSNYAIAANGVRESYDGNLTSPAVGCPGITDARDAVIAGQVTARVGCGFAGNLVREGAQDQRDQYRIDADWVLGDHLLKFGIDIDKFSTLDGNTLEGGERWVYQTFTDSLGTAHEVATRRRFRNGADLKVDQKAYYVQDNWQITNNFMAYFGARWDSFKNINGTGEAYVDIKNQFAPRLGFSWDVNGDQKFKVYGTAGRYALPLTSNVATRGGGTASLFVDQVFTYTGVDSLTLAPTGIATIPTTNIVCVESALRCEEFFVNNEFGQAKKDTYASANLKPQYQDEYILGFQAQVTDHVSVGVRGIYRDLKQAIDDTCAYDIFGAAEAVKQHLPYNPVNTNFSFCHIWNPGSDLIIRGDLDGNGTLEDITIAGALLSPKAKRTYKAMEFMMEGSWDKLFVQASYTWSQSKGNTEGGVQSNVGQADTGTTIDFDKIELTYGAYGFLPNDRTHVLKVFGNYELSDEWAIGANLLIASGRPINCNGVYKNDPIGYGNLYYSCGPKFNSTDTLIVPRGAGGRTGFQRDLGLNIAYTPGWADHKLKLQMDVFNIFNEHAVVDANDFAESGTGASRLGTTYKIPNNWQAPRSIRFSARYEF